MNNSAAVTPNMNPANIKLPGIDVSHYQGDIDWQKVKDSGIKFAFVKATDGANGVDPMFYRNWNALMSVGLPFGCYHFLRASDDIDRQITNFSAQLGLSDRLKAPLPPVLDAELSGVTNLQVATFLNTFPGSILYTDPSMLELWLAPGVLSALLPLDRPLWIAEYGTPGPPRFSPWSDWTFWQYSTGRVPGISTLVDLDWFNGTEEDLMREGLPT